VKFGISLVMRGRDATLASAATLGELAEDHGYDSVWVSDHIVIPPKRKTTFPGTADGDFPPSWREGYLESVTTLAWLAGRTHRVRLGTSALVLPLRNPLVLAKQFATVDVLSGGRLSVAVTAGYAEDEFEVIGVPFGGRGARLEEQVRLLQAMWRTDPASFDG
jgi:alkanesulfonate monooxygenase SsuD/methylene tetrahydromethanopterin reductase-like flavin-dependent oxidoreductase (luciferase family)